jgi:hypothetical protein
MIFRYLFQKMLDNFSGFFRFFFPFCSKPESYLSYPSINSSLQKRVQMYETFFIMQVSVKIFSMRRSMAIIKMLNIQLYLNCLALGFFLIFPGSKDVLSYPGQDCIFF